MPHSWYHVCMGLDTVSGLLRMVANGVEVVDEEKDYFRNTTTWKPKSLQGKLAVFKGAVGGLWFQYSSTFSNLDVFSSMLSIEKMILRTSSAKEDSCTNPGDYLSWSAAQWNITGRVTTGSADVKDVCHQAGMTRLMFNTPEPSWHHCMETCPKYNRAQATSFSDQQGLGDLITWASGVDPTGPWWLPFTDTETESVWKHHYTGEVVDMETGTKVDPNGGEHENCGLMMLAWGGWQDWLCTVGKHHPVTCACQHPGQMYIQLRGLCPDTKIDRFYVPRNMEGTGKVQLIGLMTTIIEYDEESLSWRLQEHSQNTSATSDAAHRSYALGSHEWWIEGDSIDCTNKGAAYSSLLKLTGCWEEEFTCNDGQCISMEKRCDQIADCGDESDENNCKLLVFKENYQKNIAPFTIDTKKRELSPVKVNVSTSLMSILAISEFDHTIDLKLGITLKWYENRVLYHNLKTKDSLNVLSDIEVSSNLLKFSSKKRFLLETMYR